MLFLSRSFLAICLLAIFTAVYAVPVASPGEPGSPKAAPKAASKGVSKPASTSTKPTAKPAASGRHASVHKTAGPADKPPTFSVNGKPKATSDYFKGQHVYGSAPNLPTKVKNTIVAPNQNIDLKRTPSGNLVSTHPARVQEHRFNAATGPVRDGYVKVSEGKFGDINHYASTDFCKRSPVPCVKRPTAVAGKKPLAAAGTAVTRRVGSAALAGAARVAAGPEAAIGAAAVDNAVLGYKTAAKYNALLKGGGKAYEQAHRWKGPKGPTG
jgi:hypothetical protein